MFAALLPALTVVIVHKRSQSSRGAGYQLSSSLLSNSLLSAQADVDRVKRQLLAEGVELEEFGGTVQAVETAATAGSGLRELEEALLLQARALLDVINSASCIPVAVLAAVGQTCATRI